jgi:hypothetical protein
MENFSIVNDVNDPLHGHMVKAIKAVGDHTSVEIVSQSNPTFKAGTFELIKTSALVDWDDCETAARKCDCCGNGMNEGYVYADDGYMCETCADKGELDRIVKKAEYDDREEAFDEYVYWTEWTMDDFDYVVTPSGELIELIR